MSHSGSRQRSAKVSLRAELGLLSLLLVVWVLAQNRRPAPGLAAARAPLHATTHVMPDVRAEPPVIPSTAVGARSDSSVLLAPAPVPENRCPHEMALVEGEYCTRVEHVCKHWLDDPKLPYARCGEYEPHATCVGERVKLGFCIDRFEYTPSGEALPQNRASFMEASRVCESLGKRLCTEDEWNFACEGPEMLPYPYGYARAPVCNQDRLDLYEPNTHHQVLVDRRVPAGSLEECKSPFGVYDMTGNLDEPVLRETQRYSYPFRNALKGGWWMAGRNRCRPATTAHDDHYRDIQIGIRCCQTMEGGTTGLSLGAPSRDAPRPVVKTPSKKEPAPEAPNGAVIDAMNHVNVAL